MPVIEQSPLVMECEVIDTYEIDGFKNYICNVLRQNEQVRSAEHNRNIHRLCGSEYCLLCT